jgi:hypothetical protein
MRLSGHFVSTALLALGALALSGCAGGPTRQSVTATEVIQATGTLPEASLLDVGVHLFETETLKPETATEQGTNAVIREAEARYIPFHLKSTLQNTGQWGTVRVYPARAEEVDVSVSGKLLESNGESLNVQVKVVDASGRQWFYKEYAAKATEDSYRTVVNGTVHDPFQDFYNQVANDMLAFRQQLSANDVAAIRQVAQLKFARGVAPYAFDSYLVQDKEGGFKVNRLPAENDPMFERVARIHNREYMFIDTVNIHYATLYNDMREPYWQWRKSYLTELNQQRALERKMWERRALGVLAILGAAVVSNNSNSSGGYVARDLLVIGGVEAFRSSGQFADDAKVHAEALKELGVSFKSDVAPIVDEVDGQTVKLSGSVDSQYAEWRRTLREMFTIETGQAPVAVAAPDALPAPEASPAPGAAPEPQAAQ